MAVYLLLFTLLEIATCENIIVRQITDPPVHANQRYTTGSSNDQDQRQSEVNLTINDLSYHSKANGYFVEDQGKDGSRKVKREIQSDDFTQWTHVEVLDKVGDVVLRWQPRHQEILFRVEARTRGYVGIGFSPNGGMEGADIVLGWVDDRTSSAYLLVSITTSGLAICSNHLQYNHGVEFV